MKRNIILLCALTLCITLLAPISAATVEIGTANAILNVNSSLMEQAFTKPSTFKNVKSQQIEITLNTEAATAQITGDVTANLVGHVDKVICDNGDIGYVGVYDGQLSDGTRIIADIVYDKKDIFAALTLGVLEEDCLNLTFYGEFTDSLKNVSDKHSEEVARNHETEAIIDTNNGLSSASSTQYDEVDGLTVFQGYDETWADSAAEYEIGRVSLFSPPEIRNQGTISVFSKVNTNCTQVENYLVNEQGFNGSIIVYPDTFNISIYAHNDYLHAATNCYLPEAGATTAELQIPVYAGEVLGIQFIPIPITMSSTTITTERFTSDSPYPNNILHWNIYKRFGWNPEDTDGNEESTAGMVASADFILGGNFSSSTLSSIRTVASIRYEYQYTINGSTFTLHLSTNEMTQYANITLLP